MSDFQKGQRVGIEGTLVAIDDKYAFVEFYSFNESTPWPHTYRFLRSQIIPLPQDNSKSQNEEPI